MNFIEKLGKPSPVMTAFVATAVLASAALIYTFSSAGKTSTQEELPAMEEETATKIMTQILAKVKLLAPRLLGAAQNIKQQIAQSGQEIDDATLMKHYILPHFDSSLKEIQESILDEFDWDEDELEDAIAYYSKENEEFRHINKSLRVLYNQFGGDADIDEAAATDAPPSSGKAAKMTISDIIQLMEELAKQMLQYTDDYCGKFIDENGVPSSQRELETFQIGLMQVSQG